MLPKPEFHPLCCLVAHATGACKNLSCENIFVASFLILNGFTFSFRDANLSTSLTPVSVSKGTTKFPESQKTGIANP